MEVRAYIKNLKISPKKLRFFLPALKKLTPSQALDHLLYINKKAAQIWYKVIKSAISNAINTLKVSQDVLKFKTLLVEEGRKLKRYRPGGRGTVKPIKRRYSHILVVLETLNKSDKLIEEKKGINLKTDNNKPKKLTLKKDERVKKLSLKEKSELNIKRKEKPQVKKLNKNDK